ncbi:MAG: SDR family oxidoreductase [Betaproteobacteria bacterium]
MSALQGRRVVVIGGSSGVGLAVAAAAAAQGAEVLIASRSAERVDAARARLGERVRGAVVDARDEDALRGFFAAAAPFDHVVATVTPGSVTLRYAGFAEQATADAEALFHNKFWAQYRVAKLALPHLAETGSITLFSSNASRRPLARMAVHAAVNAAIEGLARGVAIDIAPRRINVVAPARMVTGTFDEYPEQERQRMYEEWGRKMLVGRIGYADDAAAAALFLMQTGYTTGNVVYVDGGLFLSTTA